LGGVALGLLGLLVLLGVNLFVTRSIDGLGYETAQAVPTKTAAIVFGAAVWDGTPSPALADRVDGAVELYRQGKVGHLLMSGDNSHEKYDEPTAMREQAIAMGVPAAAITRDYAGFSTYDSCYRARDIFGVKDAVLVTQDYHLSRALFTCRALGIDAVGLRIADWQFHPERLTRGTYPTDMAASYTTREWLARANAVLAVAVMHPAPEMLGPYVGLVET
jgi:vancomycin permeability regulator SanA